MDIQSVISNFEKSKVGRVLNGQESFRNKVGRWMHGMAYKHRGAMVALGAAALLGSVGVVAVSGIGGVLALSPAMFMGVYAGLSPKKEGRATCEFLMNVAARKGASLAHYMLREKVPQLLQQQTLQKYLNDNMPVGCQKDYQQDFPNALADILAGNESEAQYHNPAVYLLEAVQEQFSKDQDKGGILHGFIHFFTKKYQQQKANAQQIALRRWQDRQQWEQIVGEKPKWPVYMKSLDYQRKTNRVPLNLRLKSGKASEVQNTPSAVVNQTAQVRRHQQRMVISHKDGVYSL